MSIDTNKWCIIFSDLLSVLITLKIKTLDNWLIVKIPWKLNSPSGSKEIVIRQIQKHIGITGNDKADSDAKYVLNTEITPNVNVQYTDQKI